MKQNKQWKSKFLSALFFFFIFISDNAIQIMCSKFDLKDSLNNNILKSNGHSLSSSKGQSILQMSSKTRLNLRLNKFISYYSEYSNIKINKDMLDKLKLKSKLNWTKDSPKDHIYSYFGPNGEVLMTDDKTQVNQEKLIAQGIYDRTRYKTGWDKLNIKTFKTANPLIQCWAAGYIEGLLTHQEISYYHHNLNVFFIGQEKLIGEIKKFYTLVDNNLKEKINSEAFEKLRDTENENEPQQWAYISCMHAQINGLYEGYNEISDKKLSIYDFYLMNSEGNFGDLKTFMLINNMDINDQSKFYTSENLKKVYDTDNINKIWKKLIRGGHCSAIAKLVEQVDGTYDLLAGHNTWSEYCEMLRSLKIFEWAFEGPETEQLIGMKPRKINYSSYPGVLFSGDDFYELDSKVVILQTTLSTIDKFQYKNILNVNQYIPEFMRLMITNFMSNSAYEWVTNYKSYKNHLYITQWIVLDYNVLKNINNEKKSGTSNFLKSNHSGLIYLLEEVPGSIIFKDITDGLLSEGYFGSFNLAYFKEHKQKLGLNQFADIDFTSRDYNPRYYILKQYHSSVKNLVDFSHLMRYNGFKNTHIDFKDDPSFKAPDSGISSRNDYLNLAEKAFDGGIDFKIVNERLVDELTIYAYGGPTYDNNPNLEPFDFIQMKNTNQDKFHKGIPKLWNFQPFFFSPADF